MPYTVAVNAAAMRRVGEIVRTAAADGRQPVVVTSAMSKVTDGLLDVVRHFFAANKPVAVQLEEPEHFLEFGGLGLPRG